MTVAEKRKSRFSYREALSQRSTKNLTTMEKTAVSGFLLFFLVVVGAWLLDEDWLPQKYLITQYTHWPMVSFGWTQHWSLFSPQIRQCNYHTTVEIQFADGTSKLYELPRTNVDYNDLASHFGGEKKRKLFGDNIPWPGYEQFRPDVCRFIARANDDPLNPPRIVTMAWHFANTPPPDPKHWYHQDQLPYHTQQYFKFKYLVTPEDLHPEPLTTKTK